MHITARGWNRNMGDWNLGQYSLDSEKVTRHPGYHPKRWDEATVHVTKDDEVHIAWGKNMTLTGNFLIMLRLTKEDIINLFKLSIGEIIGMETLQTGGLSIDEGVLRDRVRSMSVGQLFDLIGDNRSFLEPELTADTEAERGRLSNASQPDEADAGQTQPSQAALESKLDA
jgi:hypothetical protein